MTEGGFGDWLRTVMPKLGVSDAAGLRAVLSRHGCPSSEVLLTDWLEGASEPSFDKLRAVLSALNKALPDVDVWEAYDRFSRGEPDREDASQEPPPPDTRSLDDLIRDSRLPPGLA